MISTVDNLMKGVVHRLADVEAIQRRMEFERDQSRFERYEYWWRVADLQSARTAGLIGHISIMLVVIGYFAVGDSSAPNHIHIIGVLELLFYVFVVGLALFGLLPVAMDSDVGSEEYERELSEQHAYKTAVLKTSIRLSIVGTFGFFILVALRAISLLSV